MEAGKQGHEVGDRSVCTNYRWLSTCMVSPQMFGAVCFIPSIVHINFRMYQVTLIYNKEKIDI